MHVSSELELPSGLYDVTVDDLVEAALLPYREHQIDGSLDAPTRPTQQRRVHDVWTRRLLVRGTTG
jgi:hypothetical protein